MANKSRKYIPRVVDELLKLHLESSGAVLIEGPKWCGKTTTAKQVASSVVDLGDPDKEDEYFALLPPLLLQSFLMELSLCLLMNGSGFQGFGILSVLWSIEKAGLAITFLPVLLHL